MIAAEYVRSGENISALLKKSENIQAKQGSNRDEWMGQEQDDKWHILTLASLICTTTERVEERGKFLQRIAVDDKIVLY